MRASTGWAVTLAGLCQLTAPCLAQVQVIRTIYGSTTGLARNSFDQIVSVPDVDGDGIDDFAISCSDYDRVFVYSGAGPLLRTLTGSFFFGARLASGGDLDGDGRGDLAINDGNQISIISGASGALVRTISVAQGQLYLECVAGDLNGDGYDDILGTQLWQGYRAIAYSGRTGAELWRYGGGGQILPIGDTNDDGYDDHVIISSLLGHVHSGRDGTLLSVMTWSLTSLAAGDLDHDGITDFIAGDTNDTTAGNFAGAVRAYSGATGALLWSSLGVPGDRLGFDVVVIGDYNGDGTADVVATTSTIFLHPLHILSGVDGSTLAIVNQPVSTPTYGEWWNRPFAGGDFDGDGVRELIVSGSSVSEPIPGAGTVRIVKLAQGGRGYSRPHGHACAGSDGHLPHIVLRGDPHFGRPAGFRLRAALPQTDCVLGIGVRASPLDLAAAGAPGCELRQSPIWLSPMQCTTADGMARLDVLVPTSAALTGLRLEATWFVRDAAANAAGITVSNSMALTLGI